VDAVGMVVFAVLETFDHLLSIVFNTFFIRALDATTRWRVVTRSGEADLRTVRQFERPLHQAFSERTPTNDDTAIVVLDGTG